MANSSASQRPCIPGSSAPHSSTLFHTMHMQNIPLNGIYHISHTAYVRAFRKFVTCLLPLNHPHPPLYKFPEEFRIQKENNPDKNNSCILLKNRYVILAGSQSTQYQSILGTGTLGLEIGSLDQTGGEIPNFPIFKSS